MPAPISLLVAYPKELIRAGVRAMLEKTWITIVGAAPFLAKLWHGPLKKLLARKGFEVVGEFACRGFDTWGPLWLTGGLNWRHPNQPVFQRAREFAQRVQAALPA